ncbi:HTH and tetratricopeptide repeat-containing protein (plasmid) [Candidatus Megaera polyxenophila]|nr:HTH and tetratricopeptide repeat-containing protein [Candidatus Megaera polyxenophila]
MNLGSGFNTKKEIYNKQLNLIEGIKFTYREIDIIACILHNRGEKKIASLLLISPRTVNTHIHNIMLKLGYNSREHVIDFVEKSGKMEVVRQYYLQLLIHSSFKNQLIKIGKIIKEIGITCSITYQQISVEEKEILDQLKECLNLANMILTVSKNKEESKSGLCVLTYRSIQNQTEGNPIILILKKNNNFIHDESTYLDFSDPEQYYFVIFKLLKKIINKNSVEELIQEFNKEYQAINNSFQTKNPETEKLIGYSFSKNKLTKKNLIIVVSFILLISWIIISQFLIENKTINLDQIIIDLPLPHKKTLLTRQSIFSEIEEKLTNNNGIRTIALVGAGGSGKTTIAHRYARDQKTALIWEINCETNGSIISSFKQLAYSLCKTEKENQQLTTILQIKSDQEMEKKLFIFLTKKIKSYPNWIIIYNNVKTFNDIQQYFPYDQNVWGNGRVIITTTDHNIVNNHYILAENIIHVGILNKEEKLELFNKIVGDDKNYDNDQQSMIIKFLEKIPPFPLDVSLAASYIKEIKSSYTEYLKYITEPNEGFITVQKSILNDISEYNKTRYDIVALSVKHVIESNPDFVDLLLFICLINSEDIPKDLLIKYKDNIIVNQFIHELKSSH